MVIVTEPLISVMYDQQRSINAFNAKHKDLNITSICIAAGRYSDADLDNVAKGKYNIGLFFSLSYICFLLCLRVLSLFPSSDFM